MIVCAFDPGLTKTGWAVIGAPNDRYIAHGTIRPKGEGDDERYEEIFSECRKILRDYRPEAAAVEGQFLGMLHIKGRTMRFRDGDTVYAPGTSKANFFSVAKLIRAAQSCACAAYSEGLPVHVIKPSTWKSACGIGDKKHSKDMALAMCGVKLPEDAADAYHIGRYLRGILRIKKNE